MKNKNQNKNNGWVKKAVFTVLTAGISLLVSCGTAPVIEQPKEDKVNVEKGNIQDRMESYYNQASNADNVEEIRKNFERYDEFKDCLVQDPKFSGLEDDVSEDIISKLNNVNDVKRAMTIYNRIQNFKQFYNDVLDLEKNDDKENIDNIQKIIDNYGNKEFTKLFVDENSAESGIEFKFVSTELTNYIETNLFTAQNKKLIEELYRDFGDKITSVIESKIYDSALELAQDYNNKEQIAKFLNFLDDLSTLTRTNKLADSSYIKSGEVVYNKIKDYVIYEEEEKIGALTKKDTKTIEYYMDQLKENNNLKNYKILMDELNKDGLLNEAIKENKVEKGINNLRAYLISSFLRGNELVEADANKNYDQLQKQLEDFRKKLAAYESKKEEPQTNESN